MEERSLGVVEAVKKYGDQAVRKEYGQHLPIRTALALIDQRPDEYLVMLEATRSEVPRPCVVWQADLED